MRRGVGRSLPVSYSLPHFGGFYKYKFAKFAAPLGQRGREGRNKPALPVAETAGLFLAQCSRFPKQALACAGKMG